MTTDRTSYAYTAYTQACTFLLDGDGFCRRIVLRGKNKNPQAARRCVGAQYVASLVLGSEGGLAEMPTVGAPLLFARIDDGRVSLVRTGPLERFVAHDDVEKREAELLLLARTEESPAVKMPARKSPSAQLRSAQEYGALARGKLDSTPPPDTEDEARGEELGEESGEEVEVELDLEDALDDDLQDADEVAPSSEGLYHDGSDRTQQLRHFALDEEHTKVKTTPPTTRRKGVLPRRS